MIATGSRPFPFLRFRMSDPVDATEFRLTMRRVPSPVVVITMGNESEMRGITIGSFTSVSLDPPLISFNVTRSAQSHQLLQETDRFAVHVIGESQVHLANHFAKPHLTGDEQFENVPHQINAHGTPIIDDVTSILHCVCHDVLPAEDHSLFLGRVVDLDDRVDDGAVLYYQSSYRSVGSELRSSLLPPVNSSASGSS
jgi:flavin reductase (DIM6/NTAB) family NADH-FMN oxidoreductase RutF